MDKKEIMMIVMLGLLVLTIAMQTGQFISMSNGQPVARASGTVQAPTQQLSSGSGGSQLPANLADLPTMVGGC